MSKIMVKGRWVDVYSTFHWNATERFFRGTIEGGYLEASSVMTLLQ